MKFQILPREKGNIFGANIPNVLETAPYFKAMGRIVFFYCILSNQQLLHIGFSWIRFTSLGEQTFSKKNKKKYAGSFTQLKNNFRYLYMYLFVNCFSETLIGLVKLTKCKKFQYFCLSKFKKNVSNIVNF